MKIRNLLIAGVIVGSLTLPSVAGAEGTIEDTGPNSNNQITFNVNDSCYVTSNNNVYLTNSNQQIGTSGQVTIDGNTGSGSATSGSVGNVNESTIQGVITNSGTCAVVAVTPTPTPTPETPTGQVESASTQVAQVQAPVGGVKAGGGGTDQTGLLVGLAAASVVAIGAGLRALRLQKQV